jgi:hypothetical protein
VAAGAALFAAGLVYRAVLVSVTPDYLRDLLPSMVLGGTGVGLAMGTLIAAGVQSLPAARAATGSALVNSFRQIAATVGVAVLVTILGAQVGAGSVAGFRAGWLVGAVLSLGTAAAGFALSARDHRQLVVQTGGSDSQLPMIDERSRAY